MGKRKRRRKKRKPAPLGTFALALSEPWEYHAAGYRKPKKRAFRATVEVVVWDSVEDLREATDRSKRTMACTWISDCPPRGTFGPAMAEIHLARGHATGANIVHEIAHALSVLPQGHGQALRPTSDKQHELHAYRQGRVYSLIAQHLAEGFGIHVPPGPP